MEAEREVYRRRRFADAALARGDRDDRPYPRDRAALLHRVWPRRSGGWSMSGMRGRAVSRGTGRRFCLSRQHCGHRENIGQDLDGLLGGLAQRFEARTALWLDLDCEADIAVADDEARDHAERDDVSALFGIADLPQRIQNPLLGDLGHVVLPAGAADPFRFGPAGTT